jgi:Protein of unknown function (DUF3551)
MKATHKVAAISAIAAGAFALLAMAGSGAALAMTGKPDAAYCSEGSEDVWCGYHTYQQCQEAVSGLGKDCVANVWRGESSSEDARRSE